LNGSDGPAARAVSVGYTTLVERDHW
jgi:hypothetical protein